MASAEETQRWRRWITASLFAGGLFVLVYFGTWCLLLLSSLNTTSERLGSRMHWLRELQSISDAVGRYESLTPEARGALPSQIMNMSAQLRSDPDLPDTLERGLSHINELSPQLSVDPQNTLPLLQRQLGALVSSVSWEASTFSTAIDQQWVYLYLLVLGAMVLSASNLLLLALARRSSRQLSAMTAYQEKTVILESLQEGILVHHKGKVLYANPAVAKMLAEESELALIGQRLKALEGPEEELTEQLTQLARRKGAEVTLERLPTRKIAFEGAPASLITLRDITQEAQMRARLRMTDQLASVGTLAAGVAHEINNPLAYLVTNVSYALDESSRPNADLGQMRAALKEAKDGAARVQRIVRDIKLFSRAADDPIVPTNVEAVLESALNLTNHEIRQKAKLLREYSPLPQASANESRLGQVFVNLLINAAQAIPSNKNEEGEIRVKTWFEKEKKLIWVEIKDSGQGIPPHVLPRIFDPFFTTKPVGEGTGLGLSLCHGIVTAFGGSILVDSAVGVGTAFRVSLPMAQIKRTPKEAPTPTPTPTPKFFDTRRILIIDDEPAIRMSLQRFLRGYQVVSAFNGKEGLELLPGDPPFALILCDLMMPICDGIEFYQRLLKTHPDMASRVVFMSGGVFSAKTQEFLQRLPNFVLEKPFEVADLLRIVKETLALTDDPT